MYTGFWLDNSGKFFNCIGCFQRFEISLGHAYDVIATLLNREINPKIYRRTCYAAYDWIKSTTLIMVNCSYRQELFFLLGANAWMLFSRSTESWSTIQIISLLFLLRPSFLIPLQPRFRLVFRVTAQSCIIPFLQSVLYFHFFFFLVYKYSDVKFWSRWKEKGIKGKTICYAYLFIHGSWLLFQSMFSFLHWTNIAKDILALKFLSANCFY